MTLSDELSWRGFINQTTLSDIKQLDDQVLTFYWGVDPSANSMQIGNLAAAMMVRHLIEHGHKAILLVGGATGLIGDPDGKKQERDLKSIDEIASNKAAIAEQYRRIFAGKDFEIVDNYDWFKDMKYLDFLRDVGKHVSLTQMLDRDFVKSRIGDGGAGISYAEFSYALIQGYDFLHLYREKGVTVQLAGADQWGNSIAGVSLIRKLENAVAHILTTPLVVDKTTGIKFGKSEGGAIWLDPTQTSPYKFYQFWLNIDDETAKDLIKIYTMLPREDIIAAIEQHDAEPGVRVLQKILAREVTDIVHGRERRESVARVTSVLFGGGDVGSLDESDLDALAAEIPAIATGKSIVDVMIDAGFASSGSDAKRLIASGAVSVNSVKIFDENMILNATSLIRKGKNSFALVR